MLSIKILIVRNIFWFTRVRGPPGAWRLYWQYFIADGNTMIVVHHLDNSRSQRVLWPLDELGLEYDVKRYQRDPKTMLPPRAVKDVQPVGKWAVVIDGA